MANEQVGLDVTINAQEKGVDEVAGKLEDMSASMLDISRQLSKVGRGMDALSKSVNGVKPTSIRETAKATQELAAAQEKLNAPVRGRNEANRNPELLTGLHYLKQELVARQKINQETRVARDFQALATLSGKEWRKEVERLTEKYGELAVRARLASQATKTGAGSAAGVAGRMSMSADGDRYERLAATLQQRIVRQQQLSDMRWARNAEVLLGPQRQLVAQLEVEEDVTNRLTNARYAMFAAGASLAAGSYALGAAMVATMQAAMDYETALAQIERTSGMTGVALENFSGKFRDLSSTIPIAFQDIAEIATLGGQLNVSQENLDDFTRTVAQFGMTTNVTAETAAEAFGRLNGLLPDVNDNYDALGSSILTVGVNSVATEQDIINTATQIAAVGSQAGFTADQVIGFAAAMRSVGINPYLSRGGLTRIFGEISNSIANGGESLALFGELSGRSAEQFAQDWRNDAANVFVDLLRGMEGARQGGEDLYQTMNRLNIVNSQDRQVLAVLSQNWDEVTSAMGYANQGFAEATQLEEAFNVQAGTMASRLQMLVNSLHALFGVVASNSITAFGPLIVGVTNLSNALADLIEASPLLQGILSVVGGISTVGAGVGIVAGAFTLLVAALIAGRTAWSTVKTEIERMRLSMMEQTVEAQRNSGVMAANTAVKSKAIATEAGLMASVNRTTAAYAAASAASANFTAKTGVTISTLDVVRNGFMGAAASGTRFSKVMAGAASFALGPWGIALTAAVVGIESLRMVIRNSEAQIDEWTAAAAQGADAARMFSLASKGFELQNFDFAADADKITRYLQLIEFRANNMWAALNPEYFDLDNSGFMSDLRQIEQGMLALSDSNAMRTAFVQFADSMDLGAESVNHLLTAMPELRDAMIAGAEGTGDLEAGFDGVITQGDLLTLIMENIRDGADTIGQSAMIGSEAMYYLADSAAEAGGELQKVSDILAGEFSYANMLGDMGAAMRDFALGVAEGGFIFAAATEAGQVNVQNFQALVEAAIVAGQAQGVSAADSVNQLFAVLKANGLDVMAILQALQAQRVSSIGQISMADLQSSAQGATQATTGLGTYMNSVYSNAMNRARERTQRAARSIGGGRRGTADRGSLAGAADSAANEVRTLVDYANDLKKVFDRAFEIRFGGAQAQDKIVSAWNDIAEAAAKATESIADANREIDATRAKIAELTADREIQMYFLSIAEAYDDALRAGELRAKIAGIDADLADNNNDIAKSERERAEAQAELDKGLTGNSKSAIENRSTLLDLVASYQSYLVALASSGMSQAELQSKASELKREFEQQALAAGYSADELGVYTKAFDDLATIITRVPYNVTVAFNGDPALQAMAEFDAELASRAERAGRNARSALGSGFGGGGGGIGGLGDFGLDDLFEEIPAMPEEKPWKISVKPVVDYISADDYNNMHESFEQARKELDEQRREEDPWGWFWDNFNEQQMDTPQYTTSISHGIMGAILRGIKKAPVKEGFKNAKVGDAFEREIVRGPNWTRSGGRVGTALGGGVKSGVEKIKLAAAVAGYIADGDWNTSGSTIGGKLGLGIEAGFRITDVQRKMLAVFQAPVWGSKSRTLGGAFGTALKSEYEAKVPANFFLERAGSKDWRSPGSRSGSSFGDGVKQGFSGQGVSGHLLRAAEVGGWSGRGWGAGDEFGRNFKGGFNQHNVGGSIKAAVANTSWHSVGYNSGKSFADGFRDGFNAKAATVAGGSGKTRVSMATYAEGGYTGGGSRSDIAGLVHKREFVMPAEQTSRIGLQSLEYMRRTGNLPTRDQGAVMVELSPYDRQLLQNAGDVRLQITSGQIAGATGTANVAAVRRGGN